MDWICSASTVKQDRGVRSPTCELQDPVTAAVLRAKVTGIAKQ